MTSRTTVSIDGDAFLINGAPTCPGRSYKGMKIEGLLMNARLVQGIFDDLNPETRRRWDYPDGPWDPERNTREFVEAMGDWYACGLRAFTINLQGGSPEGYSFSGQPWHNSAFEADGSLRADYMARLGRILDRADKLGLAVILGLFYFGQDQHLADEQAVLRGADAVTDWLVDRGDRHVLIEIANEIDVSAYDHDVLTPARVDELIRRVCERSAGRVDSPAGRLLVSVSMAGASLPPANVVKASDFLLLHGNGVETPDGIREMVDACRAMPAYAGQPIVFNEDDHFDFEAPDNHMLAAVGSYAGWGLFDYRMSDEGFDNGFQCVPTNWRIRSQRKRGFFRLLAEVTGADRDAAKAAMGR